MCFGTQGCEIWENPDLGEMVNHQWNLKKAILKRRKRGRRRRKSPKRGWRWCIDGSRKKRGLGFKKKRFVDRWKRRVIANIGQCQELWHSHMRELNERQNEFGLAARQIMTLGMNT